MQEGRFDGLVDDLVKQFADPYAFLRELIQNAIDAGSSAIFVRVETAGAGVRISVRDRGEGMDPDVIENKLLVLFRSGKEGQQGKIHRVEDWGRRQLTFAIQKVSKAHYVLLNIECGPATLAELENGFRFNDAVLRHLTVVMKKAQTNPSPMWKQIQKEEARKATSEPAPAAPAAAQ